MSEFKCLEPGCEYHIGIGGVIDTEEDFEQQDYYFEEIEEHHQMHEVLKLDTKSGAGSKSEKPTIRIKGEAIPREERLPVTYGVIDLGKTKMVSSINNSLKQLYLLKPKEAVGGELILEFHDVRSQIVNVYRAVVTELEISVWSYPDGYGRELPVGGLDRLSLDQERFIFPESFCDKVLKGREGFVLNVHRMGVLSRANNELSHNSSPSVGGAPSGAGVGTSESTEGDRTPGLPEMKKHPAVTAAGCEETKPNGKQGNDFNV